MHGLGLTARRVLRLLPILALCAGSVSIDARAACYPTNYVGEHLCDTQGEAYLRAVADAAHLNAQDSRHQASVEAYTSNWNNGGQTTHDGYRVRSYVFTGGWWSTQPGFIYKNAGRCDLQPSKPPSAGFEWWEGAYSEDAQCFDGCTYTPSRPDDTTYQSCIADEQGQPTQCWHLARYAPSGDVCAASATAPPPTQPGVTCNAELTSCQDQDGQPYACLSSGGTLTCVPLAPPPPPHEPPDDPPGPTPPGQGDTNTPGVGNVQGGQTCDQPLQCSGDVIMCAQVWQQWRTRCAAEGYGTAATGFGGDCGTTPQCKGPPIQCMQLLELHKQRCGTGNGRGVADALGQAFQLPSDPGDPEADPSDHWADGSGTGTPSFDNAGWGWSRTCPWPTEMPVLGGPLPNRGELCNAVSDRKSTRLNSSHRI